MAMKIFTRHKRLVLSLTIVPLLMFLVWMPDAAFPRVQEKPGIQNPKLEVGGNIAIITYDLIGQIGVTYEISATLLKEGDLSFRVPVKTATGDIGKGVTAGPDRRIQWEWRKDLPKDFQGGTGYSVEILVVEVSEGGGSWFYYVLGGAVIAGGAVALMGGKHSGGSEPPASNPVSLPSPPGKPF